MEHGWRQKAEIVSTFLWEKVLPLPKDLQGAKDFQGWQLFTILKAFSTHFLQLSIYKRFSHLVANLTFMK